MFFKYSVGKVIEYGTEVVRGECIFRKAGGLEL